MSCKVETSPYSSVDYTNRGFHLNHKIEQKVSTLQNSKDFWHPSREKDTQCNLTDSLSADTLCAWALGPRTPGGCEAMTSAAETAT